MREYVMKQVWFNDVMLHNSTRGRIATPAYKNVMPLVALHLFVSTEFKSLVGFPLWSVLYTSDDIIRGKESNVASCMIHVGVVQLVIGYSAVM
jgi:hypothetical protein